MKVPYANLRGRGDVDMDSAMTPMIDVVFLLLVFFVWTAGFQIAENIMPAVVSAQAGSSPTEATDTPPPDDFEDVIIGVDFQQQLPQWQLNQQPVATLEVLQDRLATIADVDLGATVIVHPQPAVPLEFVIDTYDAVKATGFEKVSFAVNPESRR